MLLAGTAHAQTAFSIGPRIGLNVSTVHHPEAGSSAYSHRTGFEAGLTSTLQLGHVAVQPSLLFSQKGYNNVGSLPSYDGPVVYDEQVRLNYLTLPLNLALTLGKAGQGFQVFAGPYASLLLGGKYVQQVHEFARMSQVPHDSEITGKVKPASQATDFDNRYAQRFDGGLQAGVGYRFKGLLLQASYSVGLRDLTVPTQVNGYAYTNPARYNRAGQVSLSYLLGAKG